jgi:hypothetical protein
MRMLSIGIVLLAVVALVAVTARLAPSPERQPAPGTAMPVGAHPADLALRWAPGCDEARFAQARPGMSEGEVVELLGAPLAERSKEKGHGCTLVYAWTATDADHWQRTVEIGAGGHVTTIRGPALLD